MCVTACTHVSSVVCFQNLSQLSGLESNSSFTVSSLRADFCSWGRITSLDMATAVQHLGEPDPELQVLGAAYIQHECYNDSDAKVAVGAHTDLLLRNACSRH